MASALLEQLVLIPVGEDVAVPVTVVLLGAEPDVLQGELRRLDWDSFRLCLPDRARTAEGTRLIVSVGERTKLAGRVLEVQSDLLLVSRDPMHATDDRAAPRVLGQIHARWRPADGDAAAWLAGGPDPGPFSTFQGTADVSMSGMRFFSPHAVPVGSKVLIELSLSTSGQEPQVHRLLGLVRRIEHAPRHTGASGNAQSAIGVEFVDVPEPALDALSDFTLEHL